MLGAAAIFLLSVLGPVAPVVAGAGRFGKLALDRFNKGQEVRRARTNLLGVLATTPRS